MVAGLADAAGQQVAHAEFGSGPFQAIGLPLVGEARIAGDDEQPTHARQRGDDLVDHAVGEIILRRIAAEILEGQHGDRRRVVGALPRFHGRRIAIPHATDAILVYHIASPQDGADQAVRIRAECLADILHALSKGIVGDGDVGPDGIDQLILADDAAGVLQQIDEQRQRFGAQVDVVPAPLQPALVQIEPVAGEFERRHVAPRETSSQFGRATESCRSTA